jgi:hypothetical protein
MPMPRAIDTTMIDHAVIEAVTRRGFFDAVLDRDELPPAVDRLMGGIA